MIATASGIVGIFGTHVWDEFTEQPAILAPGHVGRKRRQLTKWGWMSLVLMLFGALVALVALIAEGNLAKRKELEERRLQSERETAHQAEIKRIQKEHQEAMEKKLAAQRLSLAEMFFKGRDLDSERAMFLDRARLAGVDVRIPERSNSFSSSNLTGEIQKAMKSLPEELRAASRAKNQSEAERVATRAKATELDKAIRPHVLNAWTLIQSVLAQAQVEGLITVTNIDPIPMLPEQLVYSRFETNVSYRLERFFGTNCHQRVAFGHGDSWLISMLPGVLDSSSSTNANHYPKIRIGRPGPNATVPITPPLALLSFNPHDVELTIAVSNSPQESNVTLKPEDRVAASLVEILRKSVLQSH